MSPLPRLRAIPLAERSPGRGKAAWILAVAVPAAFAVVELPVRSALGPTAVLLCALLVAAAVAVIGGVPQALTALAVGGLLGAFFDTAPYESLRLSQSADVVGLAAFAVVGVALALLIDELTRLLREQAALRRVATLVARGAPAAELFAATAREVGRMLSAEIVHLDRFEPDGSVTVLAAWSNGSDKIPPIGSRWTLGGDNLSTRIAETRRPARIDSYAEASGPTGLAAREAGHRSAAGTPIVVDDTLWGLMAVVSLLERPLAADIEKRLAAFTDMLAAAIAEVESRADLAHLAARQAALRRVATLVAREAPAEEAFAAVAEEVGRLPHVDVAHLVRYESDATATFLASWSAAEHAVPPDRERLELGGENIITLVSVTGRPARLDSYAEASGAIGMSARALGRRAGVGVPIIAEGQVWGAMCVGSNVEQPLPRDTEARLGDFTDLLATAIANAASRADLARLADEQSALRRVATRVAGGAVSRDLFVAVTEEVARLLPIDFAGMGRYESDGTVTFLTSWSKDGPPEFRAESRYALGGKNLSTLVAESGAPARLDWDNDASGPIGEVFRGVGVRSGVGTPIIVEGRLWGLIVAGSTHNRPLPPDLESRLGSFTELVATAIANAEGRAELAGLAEEQAALRRVATLVARGVPPRELFEAVTEAAGQVLAVDQTAMCRYDSDEAIVLLAAWSRAESNMPAVGTRFPLERESVATIVLRTGRPARLDELTDDRTVIGTAQREAGLRSLIGTPIVVEGRLWGMMVAGSTTQESLPAHTEERLAAFTDLMATAIANADSRAELDASRARIIAAADDTRRRIERDLHDGAQQRLVALGLELRAAQAAIPSGLDKLNGELDHVADGLARVQHLLREIARGIHPAILAHGGLGPVMKTLARQSPIPVQLDLRGLVRLSERVEVAAYYVVSEALTNAAKHSHASVVDLDVEAADGCLHLRIRDDGTGGADPTRGSGLVGLKDRIEALGGTITVDSRPGTGTSLLVEIPLMTVEPPTPHGLGPTRAGAC